MRDRCQRRVIDHLGDFLPGKKSFHFELDDAGKQLLEDASRWSRLSQAFVMTSLVAWFAGQSQGVQGLVLNRYPKEIRKDIARLLLKKLNKGKLHHGRSQLQGRSAIKRHVLKIAIFDVAKRGIETTSERCKMLQSAALSRVVEWFLGQDDPTQAAVMGLRQKEGVAEQFVRRLAGY